MEKRSFNLNTVLLLIVLAGLIVLYILFFTMSSGSSENNLPARTKQSESGMVPKIVYVNIDSLNANYGFVAELKEDLEKTGNRMQREVLNEQAALEKEAENFQRKIAANILTEDRAQRIYQDLMERQQALMEKKDRYTQIVAEKEFDMNLQLLDTVNQFLLRYNRIHGYDYILAFRTAGEILVASDSLDITKEVVEALNNEYESRK
jgi:outer membrane protein